MSNIYFDVVEEPIRKWIADFCEVGYDDVQNKTPSHCLLFSEEIGRYRSKDMEMKSVMVHLSHDELYMPEIYDEINVEKSPRLCGIISTLKHHIETLYPNIVRELIETKDSRFDILKNTKLIYDKSVMQFMPTFIDVKFIKKYPALYEKYGGDQKKIFNDYTYSKNRLGINISILGDGVKFNHH